MSQQESNSRANVPAAAGQVMDSTPPQNVNIPDQDERSQQASSPGSSTPPPRTFPPPHTGQVPRRLPAMEYQQQAVQDTLENRVARENDPASRLFPNVDPHCDRAADHRIGIFCHHCRGIHMLWGAALPRTLDDNNTEIRRGPPGSLLQGVHIQNPNAVATLSALVYLTLRNESTRHSQMHIDGLNAFEARYVAAAQAARQVVRLFNSVRASAPAPDWAPSFPEIIYQALLEPDMTYDDHRNTILRTYRRREHDELARTNLADRPRGQGLGAGLARAARDEETMGAEPGEGSSRGHGLEPLRGLAAFNPNNSSAESLTESGRPSSAAEEDDIPGSMIFEEMPSVEGTIGSAPAKRGNWEFVPGTDLSPAVVGQEDPSKYFLVRQDKDDPKKKDCRQYPNWRTMDWNDPDDVAALNRGRRQIQNRTGHKIAEPRLQWTQLEKDTFKELIQNSLNNLAPGQNRKNIDWDKIQVDMTESLKNVLQKKGQPLAQTTKVENGIEQPPKYSESRIQKLKADRQGCAPRTGKGLETQAKKFGDIWLMLNASKPFKQFKKRKLATPSSSKVETPETEDEGEDEDVKEQGSESDVETQPKKRVKRTKGPKDIVPGPKSQGPPPAGGAAGAVVV